MKKTTLSELNPAKVWRYFDAICQIPHCTNEEEALAKYIEQFANDLGLEVIRDKVNNIIIKKPATTGMENCKTVILQAHLDMVGQKRDDVVHDFAKDPIESYVDGDWVRARGTTLGADNGIGVAAAMAILAADDIKHGPLEALFTVDEEQNYTGALAIKKKMLQGEIMLNLDTEDDKMLIVGSAGGVTTFIEYDYQTRGIPNNCKTLRISVDGLKGGHSGVDIHLGLGNANKIMARILWCLANKYDLALATFHGGNMFTAIPRSAFATVVVPEEKDNNFVQFCKQLEEKIKAELVDDDKDFKLSVIHTRSPKLVFTKESQAKLLNALYGCPNGVLSMSKEIDGLVEASSNLASVKTEEKVYIITSQRSAANSLRNSAAEMVRAVFELAGGDVTNEHPYPGWHPNLNSEILQLVKRSYEKHFDHEPIVTAIHAGLECGLFLKEFPHLDIVSFGPTIKDPHSPSERVNIKSVTKFWKLLLDVLANIPCS